MGDTRLDPPTICLSCRVWIFSSPTCCSHIRQTSFRSHWLLNIVHPQREASFPLGTATGNLASANVVEFPQFAGGVSTRTIKMRRGLVVFLVINLVVIAFLVRSVFTLLTLLIEDGSADAIHSAEIPAPNSPLIDNLPQLIPKLIHQTYVNETIPEHWREAQRSCIDLHEDYEYKVGRSSEKEIRNGSKMLMTNIAMDRRQVTRADCNRVSMVPEYF